MGKTGFLDAASFREYLKATGQWGQDHWYTDKQYEADGWPEACHLAGFCDEAEGITMAGLEHVY